MSDKQDDVIMTTFKMKILKSKILPCITNDIDEIIRNRKRWEIIGTFSDYLENILIAMSFIFLVINLKVELAIIMGCTSCCKYSVSYSQKRQAFLTEKLNNYLKEIGLKEYILDISDDTKETKENEVKENDKNENEDKYCQKV